jgi:hypothetical protein
MHRRSLLLSGLGGAVTALLASRLSAAGQAAEAGRPAGAPRFVFVYTPGGRNPSWRTGTPGRDYAFGPTMTMFEPYKERTALLDGFTTVNFGYHINAHWGPLHTMLGGRPPLRRPGDQGGALSVGSQRTFDHLLADRLGQATPVRNIVLGGRDRDNGKGSNSLMASWIAPATPQHPVHDPDQSFAALFGGDRADEAHSALRDPDAARRAMALERDILGLSRAQLASFERRLGRPERQQLEVYAGHLRELYDQVARESEAVAAGRAPACTPPRLEDLAEGLPDSHEYARHHDLQSRILAAALACGRTRVATYVMAGISCKMTVPGTTNSHHYHNDAAVDHYAAFDRYYGDRVKFLLDELARFPEGNGTLLDNTVVLWTTDISWTPIEHDQDHIPIYLFGGLPGGKLKLGQYVKVPYDDGGGDRVKALASVGNRRLHEVLLTLAHAVGLRDFEGFADPKYNQGLVTELLA